jgi:hypothetical protein
MNRRRTDRKPYITLGPLPWFVMTLTVLIVAYIEVTK